MSPNILVFFFVILSVKSKKVYLSFLRINDFERKKNSFF